MNEGTTALFFLDHWERTQPSPTQTARLASCFFWKSSFYLVSLQQQTDVLLRDLGLGKTPYIFGRKSWLPFPDHCFQNLPAMLRGSISHHHKRKLCYLCTFSQSPWWAMITCERRVQSHKLRGHWKFRLCHLYAKIASLLVRPHTGQLPLRCLLKGMSPKKISEGQNIRNNIP